MIRQRCQWMIIMANIIPPNHVDDLPIVKPNQPDVVPVIPEHADPLNPPPPTSDSEPEDVNEVEDTVEPEDETVPPCVHEVGESRRDIDSLFGRIASLLRRVCGRETAYALVEKKGKEKDKYYGKLIADLVNEMRTSIEEGAVAMENLVRKLGNAEERNECKRLKKELEESRVVVFEERLNEAIDVSVEDEERPSSEPRGSPRDS
ncbi:hypothetical protein Tco_0702312 [Tanacetum coccineum]|uniref:Uncharacterized protein n=1 Tax=Tanacetum coccineum TaxID=301880 RepID=A0ABQ4XWF8_9ASTR